ncbi:MAG: hypothetical protein U5L95_01065 [Candidatus Saccharibacteria bacterium]|nr:hypothetical protein [Candidatus Saccharibacteria bacterium]
MKFEYDRCGIPEDVDVEWRAVRVENNDPGRVAHFEARIPEGRPIPHEEAVRKESAEIHQRRVEADIVAGEEVSAEQVGVGSIASRVYGS